MRLIKPKDISKAPFLNLNPLTWWSGPENIAQVRINDKSSLALLDSGLMINAVIPEFIKVHSLDIGPLSGLANSTLGINGFGGIFPCPLGYVIIRVQVEGVQVALVVSYSTIFGP